jgi:pimeloyl-ACP methyl ester carboxylesterase
MFDYIIERAKANKNTLLQSCFTSLFVKIEVDATPFQLLLQSGNIEFSSKLTKKHYDFTLSASKVSWLELKKMTPKPGFQCLSTMRRTQNLIVTGDILKFHQHLLLMEMLFSNIVQGENIYKSGALSRIEELKGQYLHLDIDDVPHRLYFEEAGSGIPLVCLHTAGSDSRQYQHLLNDPGITKNFRVITFDLPWHGKSSPPHGFEKNVYQLTTKSYLSIIVSFLKALGIENSIVMGCSIGGRAVLHLALNHGNLFRAVIGLQSALFAEDRSLGTTSPKDILYRPDVHGGQIAGALMAGMTAPQSPSVERWETMWHYMQGGPGIFKGDLNYYFADGDLRDVEVKLLQNSNCPIYLLNGEYDASATPEMGQELSQLINAEYFQVMENVGHFPMSENPIEFRRYLMPVLEKILQKEE